jgi:hypothetical protein
MHISVVVIVNFWQTLFFRFKRQYLGRLLLALEAHREGEGL